MLYTEKEKHEIDRVKEVFAEHLRQSPDFELLWSDKVGYVWLTIGVNPVYVDLLILKECLHRKYNRLSNRQCRKLHNMDIHHLFGRFL